MRHFISHLKTATFFYLLTFIGLFILSLCLNTVPLIQHFEQQTVDVRFRLRGERLLNPDIRLVLVTPSTLKELGSPPYSEDVFKQLISGLQILGAKFVAIDLSLFNDNVPAVLAEINEGMWKNNLIFGKYLDVTSYVDSINRKTESPFKPNKLSAFPELICKISTTPDNGKAAAHLNINKTEVMSLRYRIPLFLDVNEEPHAALFLEFLRHYYNLKPEQMKIHPGQLEIRLAPNKRLKIPLTNDSGLLVNYLGKAPDSSRIDLFEEILKLTSQSLSAEMNLSQFSILKNHIILVGRTSNTPVYSTPFADLPGIFIQANVFSNILEQEFITLADETVNIIILIILLLMSFGLALRCNFINNVIGFWGLLILFWAITIGIFIWGGIVINMVLPTIMLFSLMIATLTIDNYQMHQQISNFQIPSKPETNDLFSSTTFHHSIVRPFLRFVIPLIKLRDECIIMHTIETDKDLKFGISPFYRSPQTKHPYVFRFSKLNRISMELKCLEEAYDAYLQTGQKTTTDKPIDLLKRIGQRVYNDFGLTTTLSELFALDTNDINLNFIIDDPTIPWHWAYDSSRNCFLCDKFPVSYSFAIEKVNLNQPTAETPMTLASKKTKRAVLLYANWDGHPDKELKEVAQEVVAIRRRITSQKAATIFTGSDLELFLNRLDEYIQAGENLRLIHYTGHIEKDRLDVNPKQYLKAGTLNYTKNFYFHSRPVVFLNGCKSGDLGYLWDKYDDLATEFLACGAAACIITHQDIIETTARRFSETFYKHFITYQLTVGEALRRTRLELSQVKGKTDYAPDYDLTRYYYNLYGDPTVCF